MAKALLEKYRLILENDPGSLVFIELAKALIDRGAMGEAIETCRAGLEHNPDSIVGHVLYGKALIGLGRPAEAMEQFDKAIAIERDNPYAYNLIGEVLLHKGLYRSALPILKKAVALQPNESRVRQWLDQAQRAVSGLPHKTPPRDMTQIDAGPSDDNADPTLTDLSAYVPQQQETVPGLTDVFKTLEARQPAAAVGSADAVAEPATGDVIPGLTGVFESLGVRELQAAHAPLPPPAPAAAPAAETAPRTNSLEIALEGFGAPAPAEPPAPPAPPVEAAPTVEAALPPEGAEGGPPDVQSAPAPEAAAAPADSGSLLPELDDLPPPDEEPRHNTDREITAVTTTPADAPAATPSPARAASEPSIQVSPELTAPPPIPRAPPLPRRGGLLDELPDDGAHGVAVSEEMPSVVIAPEAAEDIAREYERELREKLLATPPPTFWRRHWLPLSLAVAGLLAIALGTAIYTGTRRQNRGNDLIQLRSQAYRALGLDTPAGYRSAIDVAHRVLAIAPEDLDARAVLAFAEAELFHGHGQDAERRVAAERELEAIRAKYPGFAMAIPWLLASDPASLEAAKAPILEAAAEKLPQTFEGATVLSIAGKLLLTAGKHEDAVARFGSALKLDAGHVATLTVLGDYYLSQSEAEQALQFYNLAKGASPDHVPALIGAVNAALAGDSAAEVAGDLDKAKAAFAAARAEDAPWPPALQMELDLAEGRALAAQGKHADAVARLSAGATEHRERAADFYSALGAIEARAGNFDKAEAAYARAVERRPGDPDLKEELARALIAQGRFSDAVKQTESATADERRLQIVRGLALLEMGQHAKAREALAATVRKGKVPTEAAIYLAMIDTAAGQRDTARAVLENASRAARGRGLAHVALGKLMLEDGKEQEAIAAFTAAEGDARDWEGACSLGRLHLRADRFEEAKKHLEIAVARNKFHQEARVALGEALLALGDAKGAQAQFKAALEQKPDAPSRRGLARALLAQGDLASARSHAMIAQSVDPKSPDTTRLAAQIALAAGDAQEAIRALAKSAQANPRDPAGFNELGEMLIKTGDQRAAKKAFEAALRAERGNLRARLGVVNAALPNGARAVLKESDALVAATASAPSSVRARALALSSRVHLSLNDVAAAGELAQKAVAADDASADAHLAVALVAKANKDSDVALKELQRVVGLDPTIAEAHLALADSLARDPKQTERAIAELETYLRIAPKGPDSPMARKILAALRKR